jgi:hypothetical protein
MRLVKFELEVPYSGSLRDTALLVGLRNTRAPIGAIPYCGEQTFQARRYAAIVNEWLKSAELPEIDTQMPCGTQRSNAFARRQLEIWGWGEEECTAAIRLAGLPLPPCPASIPQ